MKKISKHENFQVYVRKIQQYVTFTVSFYQSKGKLIDFGKMFGLHNGLPKDSINLSLISKETWESCESMWDRYSRLDVLP